MPGNSGQGSSGWAAVAAVRTAVIECVTLPHPRRTDKKAVIRVSCFVKNLNGIVASSGGSTLTFSVPTSPQFPCPVTANVARREDDRERQTGRGHWLRNNIFSEQCRTMVNNREQGNSDLPAGAVV